MRREVRRGDALEAPLVSATACRIQSLRLRLRRQLQLQLRRQLRIVLRHMENQLRNVRSGVHTVWYSVYTMRTMMIMQTRIVWCAQSLPVGGLRML